MDCWRSVRSFTTAYCRTGKDLSDLQHRNCTTTTTTTTTTCGDVESDLKT